MDFSDSSSDIKLVSLTKSEQLKNMMITDNNNVYYQKYLKYKRKYLALKKSLGL